MLVVTANWAFSDGTLVAVKRRARAARAWLRTVRRGVVCGSFGRDGAYRPPRAVDVVLAGDTFDGLTSAVWLRRERPWHPGPRAAALRGEVLRGCALRAATLLAGLTRLAGRGLEMPAADRRGRPSAAGVVRVPVRVALLVGDRDRHLPEATAAIVARGGVVAPAWAAGAVTVRHGHEFDPACHGDETATPADRPPTLAESVAVDLVARFVAALASAGIDRWAVASLVEALVEATPGDVAAIVGAWMTATPIGHQADPVLRREVAAAWRRSVDRWVRETRQLPPDCGLPVSPIDALAAWFVGDDCGALPRAVVALLDRHPPSMTGEGDDSGRVVVLGHQEPGSDDVGTLCLGRPPLRRFRPVAVVRADRAADVACVAATPAVAEPTTIACDAVAGRLRWWPIAGLVPDPVDRPCRRATVVDAA